MPRPHNDYTLMRALLFISAAYYYARLGTIIRATAGFYASFFLYAKFYHTCTRRLALLHR